jgi:hypothetical protein
VGKVPKRCGLQFVLVAERFGLKTIFRPLSAADKFGRARTSNYYRKALLFGAKGSKIKGEAKVSFPSSRHRSLVARSLESAGNQLLF